MPVALGGAKDRLAIDNLNDFGFEQDTIDSGYPQVLADLFRRRMPFAGPAGVFPVFGGSLDAGLLLA